MSGCRHLTVSCPKVRITHIIVQEQKGNKKIKDKKKNICKFFCKVNLGVIPKRTLGDYKRTPEIQVHIIQNYCAPLTLTNSSKTCFFGEHPFENTRQIWILNLVSILKCACAKKKKKSYVSAYLLIIMDSHVPNEWILYVSVIILTLITTIIDQNFASETLVCFIQPRFFGLKTSWSLVV